MGIYHFTYKTTNLINCKFYLGKHSSEVLEDRYLGTNKHLQAAIRKYGRENFKREILNFYDSEEAAFIGESELVTQIILDDPMCYNKCLGGKGGNFKHWKGVKRGPKSPDHIANWKISRSKNKIPKSKEERKLRSESMKNSKSAKIYWQTLIGKVPSEEQRRKQSISLTGRTHTKEHNDKVAASLRGRVRQKLQCPHCGTIMDVGNYTKHHGDKCKKKGDIFISPIVPMV